jgi:hypothetical protein
MIIIQTIVGVLALLVLFLSARIFLTWPYRAIRARMMHKLARDFGLSYSFGETYSWRDFFLALTFRPGMHKRNLISGTLNDKTLEIWDFLPISANTAGRDTVFKVDGALARDHERGAMVMTRIVPVVSLRYRLNNLDKVEYYTSD